MMNFYHCAQPTYEDIALELGRTPEWTEVETEEIGDRRPGAPAPRTSIPLFPLRSARDFARGRPVVPNVKRYLSPDVWRYRVMLFCDLGTLLRLHVTCQQLRRILDDPLFVVEWQRAAWFLRPSGCRCERNLFYVDVTRFFEFGYDAIDLRTSRDSEVALKACGRSVNLEVARRLPYLPYIDPTRLPGCFAPGVMDVWYDNWILPVPRMVHVRVEEAVVHHNHEPTFWGTCHPVPEVEGSGEEDTPEQRAVDSHRPMPTGFSVQGPDIVQAYLDDCKAVHRDPYDPAQDNGDCLGYHAVRWARRKIYETGVGVQTYPMALCLRRSDLTGRAWRQGTQHLEYLYLTASRPSGHEPRGDAEVMMLPHAGPIFFHPIRYNNERGDFVPWALSTIALLEAVYRNAWFDSMHHVLRGLDSFVREVAAEVQADMPLARFTARWEHLHRRVFLGETAIPNWHAGGGIPAPPLPAAGQHAESVRRRDQVALDLMYDPYYVTFNRVLGHIAEREGLFLTEPYAANYPYLVELLSDPHRHFATSRTEELLCQEMRDMLHVSDYIVRFACSVAPRTDAMTETRRMRCLWAYLGVGTSLLMFSPSFRRGTSWKVSDKNLPLAGRVPHIDVRHNHRFQKYLQFLNQRTLYHALNPHLPAALYTTEINPRACARSPVVIPTERHTSKQSRADAEDGIA